MVDPALVSELITARRHDDPLADPTEREREVLALTAVPVDKHVRGILYRTQLPETAKDRRRVLAALAYLGLRNLSH